MANHPGFGVLLTRLLSNRRVDVAWLSSTSGIPETELRSVVSGMPPLASQLDDLASALGFHAADLYVIADVPGPEALTPRDPAAGSAIADLLRITMALPSDQRAHIHRLVDQLPLELKERPSAPPFMYDQQEAGFGAMLANLLCGNRNLHSLTAAAKTLALLTEGRVHLAASTISGIGRGRVPLTPDRVAGFATALGIPAGDLAAITGVALRESSRPDDPLAAEMARLLWNCRRLTTAQVGRVRDKAEALRVALRVADSRGQRIPDQEEAAEDA
ncbi:hypothetical protein RKE30_02175 [Streptomyces sp. Li-HN-5-11]|uniref:hypothetical protein n=1 Tax=Streptomyces sp. Li-HN-5-11 TaxID=3075432 RepID=UPI0028AE94C6|nr:hypothetical protein [Streptomyces sp. Li-HN-5-11]WNM29290.1 hypothetical protein RKE30_02175 [Streptomyces sp. Li-HN-5-11]